MDSVISIKDLCFSYNTTPVLDRVNLTVYKGELLGLIGPNGAGKTTLLRTILGLLTAQSGEIKVAQQTKQPRHLLLGYVPQRHEFDWNYPLNVENVVMTGITPHLGWFRRPKQKHWEAVYQALEKVALLNLRERPIAELSGGQKQRALIARALVSNPKILLLDEPFTGLDHPNQDALSALFTSLTTQGTTIIMSTHDLLQAVDICSRLAMLNRKILATGSPQEIAQKQIWMDTYQVKENSALLRSIGLVKK